MPISFRKPVALPVVSRSGTLLEVNLTRAWWVVIVTTICTVLFTISGKITGTSAAFAPVQAVDYVLSFLFIVLIWQAREGRLNQRMCEALPLGYAVFFVLINDAYYFAAWKVAGDNVGYGFGVLTPAALLYLRPGYFVPFLLVNHLVVTAGILRQPATFEESVGAIYGTTIALVIAAISCIINYRTKVAELENTALVALRNEELAASNSGLLAMSQKLDETMVLAVHDLRAPLLSQVALCDLMATEDSWRTKEHAEFLGLVRKSANSMATLVTKKIADYVARNTSIEGLSLTACDLVAIVRFTAKQAQPLARSKNIEIKWTEFPEMAMCKANPEALERVFGNLISNAIKYSPSGTRIELGIELTNGFWNCEVRDEGPGIPQQDRPSLFSKLQHGTNLVPVGEESSGLGLYSASKLVESMNGTIKFEPRRERGSIFRVSLAAIE